MLEQSVVTKPSALRPGDRVALVAPSGPFDPERFGQAVGVFRRTGLEPSFERDLFRRCSIFAGTDEERLAEFNRALADPLVRAIMPVRGGYGVSRLLHRLDFTPMLEDPKVFIGFSDFTALHLLLRRRLGLGSVHGPMLLSGFTAERRNKVQAFRRFFFGPRCPRLRAARSTRWLVPGDAEGTLIGGNLTMISHSIGTPFEPDCRACILLLEDIGEAYHSIDRKLFQLHLAGKLRELRGLVLGHFVFRGQRLSPERICEHGRGYLPPGLPILADFPVSHRFENRYVPLGVRARVEPPSRDIEVLEPIFA